MSKKKKQLANSTEILLVAGIIDWEDYNTCDFCDRTAVTETSDGRSLCSVHWEDECQEYLERYLKF